MTTKHTPRAPQSAPTPETGTSASEPAPRVDYERLAEVFLTMIELETARVGPRHDIVPDDASRPDHVEGNILIHALDEHLLAAFHAVDWYAPEALRGLYVEMQLLADGQDAEREQACLEAEQERIAGEAASA